MCAVSVTAQELDLAHLGRYCQVMQDKKKEEKKKTWIKTNKTQKNVRGHEISIAGLCCHLLGAAYKNMWCCMLLLHVVLIGSHGALGDCNSSYSTVEICRKPNIQKLTR